MRGIERTRAPALGLALVTAAACSSPAPEGEAVADAGEEPRPAATAPGEPAARGPGAPVGNRAGEGGTEAAGAPPADTDAAGPTACTQIGCSDGIQVELDGFRDEVELELAAGDETRTVTCLPPGPCRHFIPDFAPPQVTATAFLGDREEVRTFTLDYREERPNGRDCPPVCRQAEIRWKL